MSKSGMIKGGISSVMAVFVLSVCDRMNLWEQRGTAADGMDDMGWNGWWTGAIPISKMTAL